jgi:hypothetical protein
LSANPKLCLGSLLLLCPLGIIASGCGEKPSTFRTVIAQHVSQTPGEIELFDPKVTVIEEPGLVQFEVQYRFTKGQPDKYYSCNIAFPGTSNHAVKRMDSWELKREGVIRDKIMLTKPGVKSFEITMSETASPQSGYKKISNVVSGPVQ